jgi:uncharacterized protein with GYD domain
MPTYVSLVRMTESGLKSIADFGKSWEVGKKRAEAMGIKHISAYGVLGPYDMMFIYEAPNEKAAAGLPLSFAPEGSGQTTTWTLIPMEEFAQLAARLRG